MPKEYETGLQFVQQGKNPKDWISSTRTWFYGTALTIGALSSPVHAASWMEPFDNLNNWTGGAQELSSGILTLTSSDGDSLVTDFEAVPSRPTSIKFRAKPAAGTPGYASLQIHFFTSDSGGLNSESLALVLGGSTSVGYKLVQAGYKGLFYAGQNQGLFTNDQQWHEFELKISQDQISVFRDGELMDDITVSGLSETPLGNRITLKAESGRWDFDWLSVSDEPSVWTDEFDTLEQWSENDETVQQSVLTVSSEGSKSLTSLEPLLASFDSKVVLKAKPAEGTPNYANLQMYLFTGPNGELNQHTYEISTGGNASSHFKLTRAGYDTQYYSGNGHGLLIDADQWQTLTFQVNDGYFDVYKGEEQVLHHLLANLPEQPLGNHLTLKAESGRWDFDWVSVEGSGSPTGGGSGDGTGGNNGSDPTPEDPDDTADNDDPNNNDDGNTGEPDTSQPPLTPHNLIAQQATANSVRLDWTPATEAPLAEGYLVYRDGAEIADLSGTSLIDHNVTEGQSYDYQVAAYIQTDNIETGSQRLLSDVSQTTTFLLTSDQAAELQLQPVPDQQLLPGDTYTFQPLLASQGDGNNSIRWLKEYGPDEMTVDPDTGAVHWDVPADHPIESIHLGVKAVSNSGEKLTETWIASVGNVPQTLYVGPNEEYKTVASGVRALNGGGTLIIRNGVYQGTDADFMNAFEGGALPPAGTATNFTTIIAEDPGQVIFDGRGQTKKMIHLAGNWINPDWPEHYVGPEPQEYIAIRGIHVNDTLRSGIFISNAQYVKLIDVAVSDSGRNADCNFQGNGSGGRCGSTNIYIRRSNQILMEDIYTWGHARYQVSFRKSLNSVARRVVSRVDGYMGLEPVGALMTYCSRNVDWQNAIVVDSNSEKFWARHTYMAASFTFAASDCKGYPKDNTYHSGISLNNSLPFSSMNDEYEPEHYNYVVNSIGWGDRVAKDNHGHSGALNYIGSYGPMKVDQVTLGQFDAAPRDGYVYFYHRINPLRISNSIIYRAGWDGTQVNPRGLMGFASSELTFNHVNFFENGYTALAPSSGNYGSRVYYNSSLALDPRTHGLSYLPVIESGSVLDSAGESGKRVGARIENRLGRSGTFMGEPGWNTLTTHSLWPYPHEDLIQTKMGNYQYTGPTQSDNVDAVGPVETLSGARGFAAPGTALYGGPISLTSYIWEQLGSPCPQEICNP